MTVSDSPSGHRPRRGGVLLYGMYDLAGPDKAPKIRIELMTGALSGLTHTERITGGRIARFAASLRWLASGGPRRVGGVYVESATTSASPMDLAFLMVLRLLRMPVAVYFRDAYQLYRDLYPRRHRRQILSDWLWRVTTPILARLATQRFAASDGLAAAIGLRPPVAALPPGTDPASPNLGAGAAPLVAYVGASGWADGFDLLVDAMKIVRERCPEARLRVVGPDLAPERAAALPEFVELRKAGRAGLAEELRDARVCVIPRPITPYANLALPVKLWDYLSMGKPVVATGATETVKVLRSSGAGLVTGDTPQGLAEALLEPLMDLEAARRMAANARAFACSESATWDARARTVLAALRIPASGHGDA